MILVDTSVWVKHPPKGGERLASEPGKAIPVTGLADVGSTGGCLLPRARPVPGLPAPYTYAKCTLGDR
jgi:hypothetical protein